MFNLKPYYLIRKIIKLIEDSKTSFCLWAIAFASIIIVRIFTEMYLGKFSNQMSLFYEFSHTFLFFIFSYVIFLFIFKKFIQHDIKKASNVLLFGYIIIIFPPIIDHIISNGKGFWSFYKFDGLIGLFQRFLTFFGDNPTVGITYGVRIEVFLSILMFLVYAYIKTKSMKKSALMGLLIYCVFFILGTFPSWITILTQGFQKGFLSIHEIHVAQMFLSSLKVFSGETGSLIDALNIKMSIIYALLFPTTLLLLSWGYFKNKLKPFLKNIRLPQIIFHLGLFFIGIGLATLFTDCEWEIDFFNIATILLASQSIILAWVTSIIINDIFDQEIDSISNTDRPLITKIFSESQYKVIGSLTFIFSIFFAFIISPAIAILLLSYQAIALIYSVPPLQLKRIPLVATFLSALASLMILIIGFILVAPDQTIKLLSTNIQWLLLITLTISLPIKDLKDITGDKKEKILTLPVIFGEYYGKTIIASGIFISFLLSVFFLNEHRLFWWSILFGGLAFWIVSLSNQNKYISYKNINWWLLGVVFLYGLLLAKYIIQSI
ncbi:UbiA family prenyltransferase [Patescibacteria group bacterium]